MTGVFPCIDGCVSLPPEEILHKFKAGEFPDKTFSRLYAWWLGIPTTQALIIQFRHKKADACYSVTPDSGDFLVRHNYYIIVYDFRTHFENLEQWMKEKKTRPRPVRCTRADITEQLEKTVERGCAFTDDFFIHVNVRFPRYIHLLCTSNGDKTYIDCSDDFDAAHGTRNTSLCVVQGKKVVVNETAVPDTLAVKAARYTESLTQFIGGGTTCEFSLVDGNLYFYTGQRSCSREVTLPDLYTKNMRVISPGVIRGIIMHVDKASLPDIVEKISKTNQKYVFLAEKPYSEFVDILTFAQGFIFNEGSMLCHLAILLREKGIPARMIPLSGYKDGDTIILE